MELPHKFKEQAAQGGKDYNAPPYKIRGRDLDENFDKVKPRSTLGEGEEPPYRLDENPKEGWRLIFPWWPPPSGGDSVLISISGKMQWLPAPKDATIKIKQFDVCQNGQPKQYTMLVWESED